MTAAHFVALALAIFSIGLISGDESAESQQTLRLGTVKVDDYVGQVLFQDPADDGKSYRVTVAISKPWDTAPIKSSRIEVWLLSRDGKALAVNARPRGKVLIEAGSLGATANAIYFFDRSVDAEDLRAVVVAVDGLPKAYKVMPAK